MHTYDIQLRRTDIDAQQHVNNVVFAQFLDEARSNLLDRHESPDAPWHVVVAGQRLSYRMPLLFRDAPVRVTSTVERIGTTSFTLAHEVRDHENLYLAATSTLVAIDGGAPRPLTDSEREYLMTLAAPRA
ncbi:thioesterase family protein [Nocardia sp. CDC153]|uniref:acyl-CoA thioesterase n=1 Tax=Nocardia sp. CDC153 TaxID=3112167 RepID=UPI002DBFEA2A|nr:thioesterase family protein [Nocardia sp. CDC153]MEC3956884.1 thioesterase family protein [Nocardia sp. CDC153]